MAVSPSSIDASAGGPGLLKLLSGLLLPPLAWFLDLQTSYATVRWACEHQSRALLLLMPVGSLGLIVLATWLSWSSWSALRGRADLEGGAVPDRSAFVAVLGLLMGATFALLVLLTFAARSVLDPCV
jgi:hypothetical protein